MNKKGVLLINIGSPASYDKSDVARYLKKFLMDERIIDLPFIPRWLLVHGLIVPRRSGHSATNYKKVWHSTEGSPLIAHSQKFAAKLQEQLQGQYVVEIAMRYSAPSIENAILSLEEEDVESYIVIPMFPQYAEATVGSAVAETKNVIRRLGIKKSIQFIDSFYKLPAFVDSTATAVRDLETSTEEGFVLFSFHGLPEKQIRKIPTCTLDSKCCENPSYNCYRSQCLQTAANLAKELQLKPHQWQVSFQSRLGRSKWIGPSTEDTLKDLPKRGFSKVIVVSPSFVADCIETIEELGMEGKEIFLENGGKEFYLAPCLNSQTLWVEKFAEFIQSSDNHL